jgi:MFS superfamily sulfate permease-like transporter
LSRYPPFALSLASTRSLLDVTHSTTQSLALTPLAMSYYAWFTRCIPAFSISAVAILLVLALIVQPHGREEEGRYNGETTWAQLVLSVYTVLLHIMSIAFPVRVCWSMVDMIRRMKDATAVMPNTRRRRVASLKSSDEGDFTFPVPLFVIIIPAYKEEMETLEMTLRVLASHSQARHCYHVGAEMRRDVYRGAARLILCRYTWQWKKKKTNQRSKPKISSQLSVNRFTR